MLDAGAMRSAGELIITNPDAYPLADRRHYKH